MVVLQFLLKPSFEKHLPRVVVFLEKHNLLNLCQMGKVETFETAKALSRKMFDLDSENIKKSVKGTTFENYNVFVSPYFEIINRQVESLPGSK
jgi:hypothetical protein